MCKQGKQSENQKGFSYIEVIICIAVVAILMIPLMNTFFSANAIRLRANGIYQATLQSQNMIERISDQLTEDMMQQDRLKSHKDSVGTVKAYVSNKNFFDIGSEKTQDLQSFLGMDSATYKSEFNPDKYAYQLALWKIDKDNLKAALKTGGAETSVSNQPMLIFSDVNYQGNIGSMGDVLTNFELDETLVKIADAPSPSPGHLPSKGTAYIELREPSKVPSALDNASITATENTSSLVDETYQFNVEIKEVTTNSISASGFGAGAANKKIQIIVSDDPTATTFKPGEIVLTIDARDLQDFDDTTGEALPAEDPTKVGQPCMIEIVNNTNGADTNPKKVQDNILVRLVREYQEPAPAQKDTKFNKEKALNQKTTVADAYLDSRIRVVAQSNVSGVEKDPATALQRNHITVERTRLLKDREVYVMAFVVREKEPTKNAGTKGQIIKKMVHVYSYDYGRH